MSKIAFQFPNVALLILRIVTGLMMIFGHGWGKLMKILNGNFSFVDILGIPPQISLILAVLIEVGCSILLIIGFKTKIMSAILLMTMITGLIFVHATDPLFAAQAKGGGSKEMAIMYSVIFLTLLLSGGGKFVTSSLKKRR